MANDLTLNCNPGSPVVPMTGQTRLIYLYIEVGGGGGSGTLPLNLSLIMDCSESMHIHLVSSEQFTELVRMGMATEVITDGVPSWQIRNLPASVMDRYPRRIDFVGAALIELSRQLRPIDQYSLIAFAGRSTLMVPATSGSQLQPMLDAARQLETLRLGNETEMAEGMGVGIQELHQKPLPGSASRAIVLTDGFTRNPSQCYTWAQKAREYGITVSTMGIGTEFNEDLLIPLAEQTGGNALYLEDPAKLPEVLRKEMEAAQAVTVRNVEVKIQLSPGVELRRVHRVTPALALFDPGPNMGGSYSLFLGDYDPASAPALLVELLVPPRSAGTYRVAQTVLAWEDPSANPLRKLARQDVVVRYAQEAEQPNGKVMNIAERVSAFSIGTRALQDANVGDPQDVTKRLRQAATRLLRMGENDLADAMSRQADALENNGELDPNATKRLKYDTRRL